MEERKVAKILLILCVVFGVIQLINKRGWASRQKDFFKKTKQVKREYTKGKEEETENRS